MINNLFRWINLLLRLLKSVISNRPYKLTIFLVDGCNLACQTCGIWKNKRRYLSIEDFDKLLNTFPKDLIWLNLSGGELTLHPQIDQILTRALNHPRRMMITLTSNGYQLPTELVEVIKNNRQHFIFYYISLDGTQSNHDTIRGKKGSFEHALATLQALKELSQNNKLFKYGINYTLSSFNKSEFRNDLDQLLKITRKINLNPAQVSHYYKNTSNNSSPEIRLSISEISDLYSYYLKKIKSFSMETYLQILYYDWVLKRLNKNKNIHLKCSSLNSSIIVDTDMQIKSCIPKFESIGDFSGDLTNDFANLTERRNDIFKKNSESGCFSNCYINCERYTHIINDFKSPSSLLLSVISTFQFVLNRK